MEITTLGAHKGETWKVEFDHSGQLHFLHVSTVYAFSLALGMTLTASQWEAVWAAELGRKAYRHGQFLLDRRGYSFRELYHKLEEKYPPEVCLAVVQRLAKAGLLNDWRYAEQLAHRYIVVRRYGLYRARLEMRRRELLDEQIDAALAPYADKMEDVVLELMETKLRRYFADPGDYKMLEKGKAALARRGFSYGEIKGALERAELEGRG